VGFTLKYLAPYLDFSKVKDAVAIHIPCTSKQAGIEGDFIRLAEMCAEDVTPTGEGRGGVLVL
jgi:D-lactate dehydrogenase